MALWTPNLLPSLARYYKAQAITGLADGDPVSTFVDSSGQSQNATQSGAARPTYKTAIINGLPVVRMAGSQTMAMPPSGLLRNVTGATFFAIVKDAAITTVGELMFVSTAGSLTRLTVQSGASFGGGAAKYGCGGRRLDADSFSGVTSAQNVSANWAIVTAVADYGNQILRLYINGVLDGENTTWLTAGSTSNTAGPDQSSTIFGGDNVAQTRSFVGDCVEIGITNSAASTLDRERIEGYLANITGLQSLLPNDHPYKNSAPRTGTLVPILRQHYAAQGAR